MDSLPVRRARVESAGALLCVKEVARRLGVTPRTVWRWAKAGTIPRPIHLNRLCVRWRPEAIDAYLEELANQRFTVA